MCHIVAHRGQQTTYPENSLESIRQAIKCGARAVEFDVQMTADHIPVVCHDITLKRTAGVDINIGSSNYKDISMTSVGEPARFADTFSTVKLPALQDMVDLLKTHQQVTAFVELKDESIDIFGINIFVEHIIECLKPVQKQCVVIADNLQALVYLKKTMPVPVGWIIHQWQADDFDTAQQEKIDYLVINHKYLPEQNYDFSADTWQWVIYETRNPDKAVRYFEQGAAFVETDDICQMLKRLPGYK